MRFRSLFRAALLCLAAARCGASPAAETELDASDTNAPDPAGPRVVLRERVVFGGTANQTFVLDAPEPFSHMARRWHAYPLTVYRSASVGAHLHTTDQAMFGEATVRLYGPARADGSWGVPKTATTDAHGRAALAVEALGAGRYVILVGPKSSNGFLARYPSDIGIGRWSTNGASEPQYFTREQDGWVTYKKGGGRYRVLAPLPGNDMAEDPQPGAVFELEGPNGRVTWRLDEWSRSTWFVRDDGADRIGDVGNLRMQEGVLDIDRVVNGQALPEDEDRYVVLSAAGLGQEAGVNPELLKVIPESIGGRRIAVRPDDACTDQAVCNEPYYVDDNKAVDLKLVSAEVRGFKPTFYDPGETSSYELDVVCNDGCAPRPASKLSSTKYPVYYAHGFNSSKLTWAHLLSTHVGVVPGMPGWFGAENVDAFSPVALRAEQLRRNLHALLVKTEADEGVVNGERFLRVNVVAHSMGGLDTRYLIGAPKYNAACASSQCTDANGNPESCCPPPDVDGHRTTWAQRVASATTLSTPHCGSSFADLGVKALNNQLVHRGFEVVARKLFGLDDAGRALLEKTMFALSQQFCREQMAPGFPEPNAARVYDFECANGHDCHLPQGAETPPSDGHGGWLLPPPKPNVPTVFSWSGVTCMTGTCGDIVDAALLPSYLWVKGHEGDNDGVVSITSAHFGIYMGALPFDHFDWTRTEAESRLETLGGRLAGWLFGVKKEPAERFHLDWISRLREAGY